MRKIIIIEGCDNIGKSTLIRSIYEKLTLSYDIYTQHFGAPKSKGKGSQYMEQRDLIMGTLKDLYITDREDNDDVLLWDRSIFGELVYSHFRGYKINYWDQAKMLLDKFKYTEFYFITIYANHGTFLDFEIGKKPDERIEKYKKREQSEHVSNLFIQTSILLNDIKCISTLVINSNNYGSLDERNKYITSRIMGFMQNEPYEPYLSSDYASIAYNLKEQVWGTNGFSNNKTKCPDFATCNLGIGQKKCSFGNLFNRPSAGYGSTINLKYIFIGEAPGNNGCGKFGLPFYGDPSGNLFQSMLENLRIHPFTVYVTNTVLCTPKNNDLGDYYNLEERHSLWCVDKKLPAEIQKLLELNKEAKVVAIGRTALSTLQAHKLKLRHPIISTYHPAYFLRIGRRDHYYKHMKELLGVS